MSGARGENQDICGHIVSGTSTYPTPLSPSNHCVLAYSIVRKSPKRVAPYYEAPIRHESCQTTRHPGGQLIRPFYATATIHGARSRRPVCVSDVPRVSDRSTPCTILR